MNPILLLSFVISFFVTFVALPLWIRRARKAKLVGKDMHKVDMPLIPEMGGICVVMGFLSGMLFYIAVRTFYYKTYGISLELMAVLTTILIIAIIGIFDDVLGWKIGLRQRHKPLLTIAAAIPMVVMNAGHHTMYVPFIGHVNFGLLYPFLIVPIAIVGASNAFNMVGGYNGLEAGMGIIILSALGFVAYLGGDTWTTVIAFCMVFALVAFYHYNMFPAKVFAGDTMTYAVGALIAVVAILGNMERAAIILFIPYFFEFLLKLRGRFRKESFAHIKKDGSLRLNYNRKIYGLEHLAILILGKFKKRVYENDVVYSIYAFELIFVIIVFII